MERTKREFNTAGPMKPDIHYTIPPLERWDTDDILDLIDREKYFVLHAPRQTGKTSCLLALRDYLNKEDEYYCVYANIEAAQTARNDLSSGTKTILSELFNQKKTLNKDLPFTANSADESSKSGDCKVVTIQGVLKLVVEAGA
jgi:hypothetical protein